MRGFNKLNDYSSWKRALLHVDFTDNRTTEMKTSSNPVLQFCRKVKDPLFLSRIFAHGFLPTTTFSDLSFDYFLFCQPFSDKKDVQFIWTTSEFGYNTPELLTQVTSEFKKFYSAVLKNISIFQIKKSRRPSYWSAHCIHLALSVGIFPRKQVTCSNLGHSWPTVLQQCEPTPLLDLEKRSIRKMWRWKGSDEKDFATDW